MKIALIHDHLTQEGGAERILRIFQEIWPEAPTFVLFYNPKKAHPFFQTKKIIPSFLQKIPLAVKKYQWFLPLMPAAIESFDLSSFDLVLSSSSAFAKGILTKPETLHICYCHTPTRFLWTDTHSYIGDLPYNWLIKRILLIYLSRLRLWDRLAAERVDAFIANSQTVAERIEKYYGRKPEIVIYPPVEVKKFFLSKPENFFLAGGRIVAYKRLDIVVQAFNKLGWPLKIYGQGPEEKKLRKMAKKNIQFLGFISEEEKANLYSRCLAYIHPQIEDFGITILEAMASGRPVIAYGAGGARETVIENVTGKFFYHQNWQGLVDALVKFKPEQFQAEKIRSYASLFDISNFKKQIKNFVEKTYENFQAQKRAFRNKLLL